MATRVLVLLCLPLLLLGCGSQDTTRVTPASGRDLHDFINAPASKDAKPR